MAKIFSSNIFPILRGPLSCDLSSPAIAAANAAVNNLQQAMPRSVGVKVDEEMKIKIGKYSSENRVSAAARRFSAELGRDINPSTIRGFKRAYLQELNRKRRAEDDDLTVTSLPAKKRGPWAPPTTSWRGLRKRLAKLNLAKILSQYKGQAISENFIPRIFLSYTVHAETRLKIYVCMYTNIVLAN